MSTLRLLICFCLFSGASSQAAEVPNILRLMPIHLVPFRLPSWYSPSGLLRQVEEKWKAGGVTLFTSAILPDTVRWVADNGAVEEVPVSAALCPYLGRAGAFDLGVDVGIELKFGVPGLGGKLEVPIRTPLKKRPKTRQGHICILFAVEPISLEAIGLGQDATIGQFRERCIEDAIHRGSIAVAFDRKQVTKVVVEEGVGEPRLQQTVVEAHNLDAVLSVAPPSGEWYVTLEVPVTIVSTSSSGGDNMGALLFLAALTVSAPACYVANNKRESNKRTATRKGGGV